MTNFLAMFTPNDKKRTKSPSKRRQKKKKHNKK